MMVKTKLGLNRKKLEIDVAEVSTRSHNTTYHSAPVGGSYRSGTGRFQRYNIPEDYAPERKYLCNVET